MKSRARLAFPLAMSFLVACAGCARLPVEEGIGGIAAGNLRLNGELKIHQPGDDDRVLSSLPEPGAGPYLPNPAYRFPWWSDGEPAYGESSGYSFGPAYSSVDWGYGFPEGPFFFTGAGSRRHHPRSDGTCRGDESQSKRTVAAASAESSRAQYIRDYMARVPAPESFEGYPMHTASEVEGGVAAMSHPQHFGSAGHGDRAMSAAHAATHAAHMGSGHHAAGGRAR